MAFEPTVNLFFACLADSNIEDSLDEEKIKVIRHYVDEDKFETVCELLRKESPERQQLIFNGMVHILPLTTRLVKHIINDQLKDVNFVAAYDNILELISFVNQQMKRLGSSVKTAQLKKFQDYEVSHENAQKRINELRSSIDEARGMQGKFEEDRRIIAELEAELQQLGQETSPEYWESLKRERESNIAKLSEEKSRINKLELEIKDLQNQLEEYSSGAADQKIRKYIESLRKLSEELPQDEVN